MISVVIPNFNGAELLKKNVPKILELLKKSKSDFELIVVDDASSDGSLQALQGFETTFARSGLAKGSGRLYILPRSKNAGFPTTADAGIRAASGEVVFVIKNDAVPEKSDYFQLMQNHFKDPEVFAVSSALRTVEKGRVEIRGCGVIYYQKGFFLHRRGGNTSRISAWADGGSSVFRKDLYMKLGGFDPIYSPGYWEDTDLGYRAWKAGFVIHFEPKALLLHDFEAGVYRKKYGPEKIKLINLRNQFIFTLKNGDWSSVLKFFLWELYNFSASLKSGETNFVKAYFLAILKLPGIVRGRIFQKKLNRLSDEAVLKGFENL